MGNSKNASGINPLCLIIAGGDAAGIDLNKLALGASCIICADSGYQHALAAGIKCDLLIGDFDSMPRPADCGCEIIELPAKKDDTDLLAAAKEGLRRGYTRFVLAAVRGSRPDQSYAALSVLLYLLRHGAAGVIKGNGFEMFMISKGKADIGYEGGAYLSIFPFGCRRAVVSVAGTEYPLDDYALTAEFPIGISNHVVSDKAVIDVKNGTVVVMTVKETL